MYHDTMFQDLTLLLSACKMIVGNQAAVEWG